MNQDIRALANEILFDFSGSILVEFVRSKQIKFNKEKFLDILLADSLYVLAIRHYLMQKASSPMQMAIYDFMGKYASKVLIKMLQNKKPNYMDLAIDGIIGEAGSTIVELLVQMSQKK